MKTINLSEIYAGLKAWRDERGITAQSQKEGYIINIMEELGELAEALRHYEKIKNGEQTFKTYTSKIKLDDSLPCEIVGHKYLCLAEAEQDIIDALCDIAVFTINAGADISDKRMPLSLDVTNAIGDLYYLFFNISKFDFPKILFNCAALCKNYGYNFEIAMLETIKEISSRTGSYDEASKKWVKDTSDEAKAKWYKADYEKARVKK